jgi:hypothetical protein
MMCLEKCIKNNAIHTILRLTLLMVALTPASALATQGHGGVEGVDVHQFAHLFFLFSMGTFIYWLRRRELVRMAGWRYLQYSALFFILWNIDAFTVHLLEEQLQVVTVTKVDPLHIIISASEGSGWLEYVYYMTKLDHLLCVPAMVLLYLALKNILKESFKKPQEGKEE